MKNLNLKSPANNIWCFFETPSGLLCQIFRLNAFIGFSLAVLLFASTSSSQTLPTGGQIMGGQAHIDISGATMMINQSTQRAAIDWKSFNVGRDASVYFNQPNSAAATLNRITGADPSQILGRIKAPGQVFISNGNGVYFGRSASVDVGSLVATTMNIDVEDFMNGQLRFLQGDGTGEVLNEGELRAKFEGFVALMAPEVRNQGLIFAQKGTVALASGEKVELELDPSGKLTGIRVEPSEWQAMIDNQNAIEVEDGLVILSAQAVRTLKGGLISNSGSIRATGIKKVGGRIILTGGENGIVEHAGSLDVSSIHGKGGSVVLEGEKIVLETDSVIDATGSVGGGEVLIGGDWQGGANDQLRVLDDPHTILQAELVEMQSGASIDASATGNGDGGTIVLWSDVLNPGSFTSVLGEIYAKGGTEGGDGGMIETSGRILAINQAKVSTIAPSGNTGMWLLDPGNIVVTESGTTDSDSLPSFPVGGDTNIHPTSIVTALGSSNISIQTGTGGYDLTVSSPISYSGSNNLTLEAGQDLIVNSAIDLDAGDLTLISGRDLTVNANISSGEFLGTVGQDAAINYAINSGSGTLTINADNDISLSANLTTTNSSDSAIVLNAGKNDAAGTGSGGDISITGSPTISVGGSGRTTFYTGSVSGSSGLTSLIGSGSGRFRYNSDESSANYTTAISSGKYAIYRERPAVSVTPSSSIITYGDATPTISASGTQNGDINNGDNWSLDTLSADSGTSAYSIADESYTNHGGVTSYLDVKGANDANGDFQVQTYSISENLSGLGYNVSTGTIRVDQREVSFDTVAKTYDDTDVLEGNEVIFGNLVSNELLGYSGATVYNKHVEAVESQRFVDAITLTNGSFYGYVATKAQNYKLPTLNSASSTVTINPAVLSVTVNDSTSLNLTKSYDGLNSAHDGFDPRFSVSGAVGDDSGFGFSYQDANYNSENVADANTLTIYGITINNVVKANGNPSDSYPSDYVFTGNVSSTDLTVAGSITRAVLSVTANDSFKFAGQSDPVNFAGVTYSGFASGEDDSVISGTTTLSRDAGDSAGDYNLTPDVSSLTAANYSFSAVNGIFTIVPSNQLLVEVSPASSVYGAGDPAFTISSVTYYDGSASQTVSSYNIDASNNQATVSDGTNNIIFTIATPQGTSGDPNAFLSTSNNVKVGTYSLTATLVGTNPSTFSDSVSVNGTHTISPKSITLGQAHVSGGKTKIYDGTPDMEGLQYDLSSLIESGDTVTVSGLGSYRDDNLDPQNFAKDVSFDGLTDGSDPNSYNIIDKPYRIENVILGGTDSSNYILSSNIIDGTDGRINQRPIHYLPAKKTYDGTNFISSYVIPETGNPYYTNPVIESEIVILDPTDDVGDAASGGIINNENFSYVVNHTNASVGEISSKHVTGPDDHKETYGFEHDSVASASRTDNYITKIVLADDGGGSEFEPQNYSLPTLNAANAPFKVVHKELTITGTRVYDSTVNWLDSGGEALTITTGVTGETLSYASATTASEHAGTVTDGVRSMTYINAITLSDSSSAVRNSSSSPGGFITDYTFSNKELWDSASGDHSTISLSSITDTDDYNDVTITPKPITISGIQVDDKIYDGGTSSDEHFSPVNSNLVTLGMIAGDDLSIDTVTGTFENKKHVTLSGATVQDKTVNLATTYAGSDVGNYAITDQATAQAKIHPRPLGFNAEKTYDGTTTLNNSNVTSGGLTGIDGFADSGLVSGESLSFTVTSNDKNVATANKYATNSGLGLADSGSYLATNYTTTAYNFTLVSEWINDHLFQEFPRATTQTTTM